MLWRKIIETRALGHREKGIGNSFTNRSVGFSLIIFTGFKTTHDSTGFNYPVAIDSANAKIRSKPTIIHISVNTVLT
ncbi:MAG: hypothetical protein J6X38_02775, partial [Abditibacteriota bacterium]|nr:hypothetical protein [Abditibacteriota bacterium]